MGQNSQQISVSTVPTEVETVGPALENTVSVLTVTITEQAGWLSADWALVDFLSFGVFLVEILIGLGAIILAILAYMGYTSIQDVHKKIRKDAEQYADKLAEEKLQKFREEQLPKIIDEAILAHTEMARRSGAVDAKNKKEMEVPN